MLLFDSPGNNVRILRAALQNLMAFTRASCTVKRDEHNGVLAELRSL